VKVTTAFIGPGDCLVREKDWWSEDLDNIY
jgi:hypothetical protein